MRARAILKFNLSEAGRYFDRYLDMGKTLLKVLAAIVSGKAASVAPDNDAR
jgi:hypothetical protein